MTRRGPDLLGPAVLLVAGLVLLAVAWAAVEGQSTVGEQLPFVSLGAGGVVLCGAGSAVYLFGLRRAVAERRAELARHRRLRGVLAS